MYTIETYFLFDISILPHSFSIAQSAKWAEDKTMAKKDIDKYYNLMKNMWQCEIQLDLGHASYQAYLDYFNNNIIFIA